MKINRTAFFAVLALVIASLFAVEPALASGSTDIFANLQTKANTTFQNVRTIAFIVAGFGIIAIAVMAYFGRFNFKHLAGLIGGLILLSAAAALISYVTTGNTSNAAISFDPSSLGDTFAK